MAGTPSADHPRAFASADLDEAADLVADHIRRVGAGVVVTYDRSGGYGHPDHLRTREVTLEALGRAGGERAAYEVVVPRRWAVLDRQQLRINVHNPAVTVPTMDQPYPPSVVDGHVNAVEAGREPLGLQVAALRCHRTQVTVYDGGYYALSNGVAARLSGREAYRRVALR